MTAGFLVWAAGLLIETVADAQKFAAKRRPGGDARWMATGLWKYSRHPNYFGELLCWWGVFVFVAGNYSGWQWAGVIGPITLTYLLLHVTGIPTLEASANRKWGANADYQAHLRRTRKLVPLPR
jgi:steroid 5-alpha reductase family enzyme